MLLTLFSHNVLDGGDLLSQDIEGVGKLSVPKDTGEAYDLEPANLTITIRFGSSLGNKVRPLSLQEF